MKNKVLKTIGYIVGITWLFTACALDDEVYGMTMLFINVLCMAYLALFSWANNWWYDLEDYKDEDDEECEEPLHYGSTSSGRRRREYGSRTRQVGGIIPPEHSKASMIRRCVQARQEILQVQKALEEGRCNDG